MKDGKLGGKIRGQMVRFSGEVSVGMCKPARRFVGEAIYGIQARQSVLLSEIARSLNEEIGLKKTETRLSKEVGRSGVLGEGAGREPQRDRERVRDAAGDGDGT
jgi:hypothetical protein